MLQNGAKIKPPLHVSLNNFVSRPSFKNLRDNLLTKLNFIGPIMTLPSRQKNKKILLFNVNFWLHGQPTNEGPNPSLQQWNNMEQYKGDG